MKCRQACATAVLVLTASQAAAAQDAPARGVSGPDLYYLDHQDVSPPLRELAKKRGAAPTASTKPRQGSYANVLPLGVLPDRPADWIDPLAPSRTPGRTPDVAVLTGVNVEGVQSDAFPPDASGAVGATQYVQWVNFRFAVFDKANGALLLGPLDGNQLWTGFGGVCESANSGDPIVAYDKAAARWVMTQFAFVSPTAGPWLQCVAVSTTPDATGAWRRFAYAFAALNDYPKLGVWSDGYYITFNMFASGAFFSGARTCALDRLNMLTPANTPGPIQCFQSPAWAGLLPADLDGTTPPPPGAPNYQLALGGSPTLRLYRFAVNWATPALSSFTGPTNVTVAPYSQAAATGAVPQPGTTMRLDTLGDRLMHRLAYRNFGTHESLVTTHTVVSGGSQAVRWYELRNPGGTPSVQQQGTYAPDGTARFMGSIAQDRLGNVALGYNASSSTTFPSLRYTGRLVSEPLGSLQAESLLVAGARSQTGNSRWGDYAAMTIDPVDDCTFWFTGEYLREFTVTGSTRIGSFRFPTCTTVPDFALSCVPDTLVVGQGGSAATTCTVVSAAGFANQLTLSCANLPPGVSCAANPNPVTPPANGTVASTLTFSLTAGAATGVTTVQVQASDGTLVRSADVRLEVRQPDFVVACGSAVLSPPSNNGLAPCTVQSLWGFASPVTLHCVNPPPGVGCLASPDVVTPPANGLAASSILFWALPGAPAGGYQVAIHGLSGTLVREGTVALSVLPGGGFLTSAGEAGTAPRR